MRYINTRPARLAGRKRGINRKGGKTNKKASVQENKT